MLRSVESMTGCVIRATDGEIGRSKDFLFDQEEWAVRYMVADTGTWLPGRKVLISPLALGRPDGSSNIFPVSMTKTQLRGAPDLEEDAPVSRQYEIEYHAHFGWPYYWGGLRAYPILGKKRNGSRPIDPHLRSAVEVTGYGIEATDGELGHVETVILDDETWVVRYIVVDTRNWLPGQKVLVATNWISAFDELAMTVHVELSRETIKNSPKYDASEPVNREYESRLYDYYGRPQYWEGSSVP